jgi:hypothetical protein
MRASLIASEKAKTASFMPSPPQPAPPTVRRGALERARMVQRAVGNQAVLRAADSRGRRIPLSQPSDRLEREADRVADRVVNGPMSSASSPVAVSPASGETAQRMCTECEEEAGVQRAAGGNAPTSVDGSSLDAVRSGGGQSMSPEVHAFFSSRFGHDLSGVRIHTDGEAARSASSLGALAYTVGRDIYFAEGRYAPETNAGRRLLAHELTHTLQQEAGAAPVAQRATGDPGRNQPQDQAACRARCMHEFELCSRSGRIGCSRGRDVCLADCDRGSGRPPQLKRASGRSSDPLELEADRMADAIDHVPSRAAYSGSPAPGQVMGRAPPSVQRQIAPLMPAGAVGQPCDAAHMHLLNATLLPEARRWRSGALAWFTRFREHLSRRRAPRTGEYVPIGSEAFRDLSLLERHFRISNLIPRGGTTVFPRSATDSITDRDLEAFHATVWDIRDRISRVNLENLTFLCMPVAPPRPGRRALHVWGSSPAGSLIVTLYTGSFDNLAQNTQTGVLLHEAFHATFPEFDVDSYSFEDDYPGFRPLVNAESYAQFASVATTGIQYRVAVMPAITITGSPGSP